MSRALRKMSQTDNRIQKILGDDRERTLQNAGRYRDFLVKHLPFPFIVTGLEDFPWEEPYVFGVWDQDEYQELKKVKPSYTDTFELLSLNQPNQYEDIMAKLKRVSDGKLFEIGLSWLCCEDKRNDAHILLDDYASWHTNY